METTVIAPHAGPWRGATPLVELRAADRRGESRSAPGQVARGGGGRVSAVARVEAALDAHRRGRPAGDLDLAARAAEALLAEARRGRRRASRRASGCRWPGWSPRSRTTSTWPGCPPPRARASYAYQPRADATARRPAARGRGDRARQDEPRPVRHRPGRHAQPVRRGPQRLGPGADLGRLSLRVGGRGGARPRRLRARHRHGRLGPGARGAERHRRGQAHLGPDPDAPASCPPAARSTASPCSPATSALAARVAELRGPRRHDPLARRHRARSAALPAGAAPRLADPDRRSTLTGLADGWAEAFAAAVARLAATGAEIVEVDIAPLLEAAALLYGGAFVAERYGRRRRPHRERTPSWSAPTSTRPSPRSSSAAAQHGAADYFRDRERLDRLARAPAAALDGSDALLTPTTTWHPTLAEVAADPVGANAGWAATRTSRTCSTGPRSPCRPGGWRAAVRGHAHRPGRSPTARWPSSPRRIQDPPLDLLVVGAHLAGQPLNHQLVAAGGTLVGPVATAPATGCTRSTPCRRSPASSGSRRRRGEVRRSRARCGGCRPPGSAASSPRSPAPMAIGPVSLADGS